MLSTITSGLSLLRGSNSRVNVALPRVARFILPIIFESNRHYSFATTANHVDTTSNVASSAVAIAEGGPGLKAIENIRNVAVIAHVDHGKTTLVDQLLKASGMNNLSERFMDSGDLEKERGITIMSKNTCVTYKNTIINIVDTPGHQDFGGEVERVMGMVDGVLLVVDASEGPMAQTRFVLMKALRQNLKPIVIINKVDRESARLDGSVEDGIFELFVELNANDKQLDFPIIYASGRDGWAVKSLDDPRKDITPIMDAIINVVPPPMADPTSVFRMVVTNMEYDNFLGRIVTGRIHSGTLVPSMAIRSLEMGTNLQTNSGYVKKIFRRIGLQFMEIEMASAGDIVSFAGITAGVTDTVCTTTTTKALPAIAIDPPTLSVMMTVNSSPLVGKGGYKSTANALKERLTKECENNVALNVNIPQDGGENFEILGRGELQLGILIEQMRRENFEMTILPPKVIFKGEKEPYEKIVLQVPCEMSGMMIQELQNRMGELVDMETHETTTTITFIVSSRCLMGFRTFLKQNTSGFAQYESSFVEYRDVNNDNIVLNKTGYMIASTGGCATFYGMKDMDNRGIFFIKPGDEVYENMVLGLFENNMDISINVTKQKKATNVRNMNADPLISLNSPRSMTLEDMLCFIAGDPRLVLDVTPYSLRLRVTKPRKGKI